MYQVFTRLHTSIVKLRSSYLDSLSISLAEFNASEAAFTAECEQLAAALLPPLLQMLKPYRPTREDDLPRWTAMLESESHALAATVLCHWYAWGNDPG